MVVRLKRTIRHLLMPSWWPRRLFAADALKRIEREIRETERARAGQIRFAVEAALNIVALWQGVTARQRALEVFAKLGVWDTEHNNGVLIYLLLADRDVEVIADRGVHARVGTQGWETVCRDMEAAFRQGHFEQGVLTGIERVSALLE